MGLDASGRRACRSLWALAAVTAAASSALVVTSPARAEETAGDAVSFGSLPQFVVVAHRGGGLEQRENSLSGFRAAALGPAQVIDLDTRRLSDGTVVVMHDESVRRTSSSTGDVAGFDRNSWAGVWLDIGSWLTPYPEPEQAPLLTQVLDELGGRELMTVEVKDAAAVDKVASIIKQRALQDSVMVNTNDPEVAKHVHALGLRAHLWRSSVQMRTDDPAEFAPYADVVDVDVRASDEVIRRFTAPGLAPVWVHTVTTRAERLRAQDLGAAGVVTDDPRYVTGARATFPTAPTTVRVDRAPAATQVSDGTRMAVVLGLQSGPENPDARAAVEGHRLTSRTVRSHDGWNVLALDTTAARAGRFRARVAVPEGSGVERSWLGETRRVSVRLTKEDLQLRPRVRVDGRDLRVDVTLVDSADPSYDGARHEVHHPTPADLSRAPVRLRVVRAGDVVFKGGVPFSSTLRDGDTRASAALTWRAPSAGTYRVELVQRGDVYRTVEASVRVEL